MLEYFISSIIYSFNLSYLICFLVLCRRLSVFSGFIRGQGFLIAFTLTLTLTLSLRGRGKKDVKLSLRGRGEICRFHRGRGKKDVELSLQGRGKICRFRQGRGEENRDSLLSFVFPGVMRGLAPS